MHSQILSNEVLGSVIAAAPDLTQEPRELARNILITLINKQMGKPDELYKMPVKEITEYISLVDEDLSESRVGHILGEMGLQKARRRDGYWVYWNARQTEILRAALGGE